MITPLLMSVLAQPALAQSLALPSLSPKAEVMQTVGVVEMRVTYSSPGKRDRTIWGDLVPYGELWRTGANAATTLEASGAFKMGKTEVPAGRYALFTIPGEEKWTVILNSNADQGGTGSYDAELDVARVDVTPLPGGERERLTFLFSDTTDSGTRLDLVWDGVKVPVPLTIDTKGMVDQGVAAFVSDAAGTLTSAARHYSRSGNHDRAIELVDQAIDLEETWFNTWIRATVLKELGQKRLAIRAAKRARTLGKQSDNFFWKDRVEKAIKDWR